MIMSRKLQPTIHIPSPDAEGARHVLQIWIATGTVPVAHIVAEPEMDEDPSMEELIAA